MWPVNTFADVSGVLLVSEHSDHTPPLPAGSARRRLAAGAEEKGVHLRGGRGDEGQATARPEGDPTAGCRGYAYAVRRHDEGTCKAIWRGYLYGTMSRVLVRQDVEGTSTVRMSRVHVRQDVNGTSTVRMSRVHVRQDVNGTCTAGCQWYLYGRMSMVLVRQDVNGTCTAECRWFADGRMTNSCTNI